LNKHTKRISILLLTAFLAVNAIAFFHAYKFTHFNKDIKARTADPNKLSATQKFKTLLFGVDNPRPVDTEKPTKKYTTLSINSGDDILECWSVPVDSAKGTVILFHGYAGNKSTLLEKSNLFNDLGYNTVLVDFAGSGGSTGNKTTIGFYESDQVKAVMDYVKKTGEQHIVLFGISMGSAAILKSVYDYKLQPSSIIIECPFGNMLQTVQARFKIMHAPSFPLSYFLVFWGGFQNNFNAFKHNPSEYAKSVTVPVLLLYGMKDNKVSKGEIDLIYKNLQGAKELKLYIDAGHENILEANRKDWISDVSNFLNQKN